MSGGNGITRQAIEIAGGSELDRIAIVHYGTTRGRERDADFRARVLRIREAVEYQRLAQERRTTPALAAGSPVVVTDPTICASEPRIGSRAGTETPRPPLTVKEGVEITTGWIKVQINEAQAAKRWADVAAWRCIAAQVVGVL